MPTKRYPLQPNGPERVEITWGNTAFSRCVVVLDGTPIANFSTPDLRRGKSVRLPDGGFLSLKSATARSLEVVLNGQPLPGSVQARSQVILAYLFTFVALSLVSLLVGGIWGISVLTANPGQPSSLIGGVGLIVGGVVIGALCALTARGLWQLKSWARIPAIVVIGLYEALLVYGLVEGYLNFLVIILMVGALIPLIQLLSSSQFRSPAKQQARKQAVVQAGAATASGSSAAQGGAGSSAATFRQQVEATLSPETRARLQMAFTDDPVRGWFNVNGSWGWIACQSAKHTKGACAEWTLSRGVAAGGNTTTIAATESAFLAAISGGS